MSANRRQWSVAALVVVVLAAAVTPWVTTSAVAAAQSSGASFQERVVYEERGDIANVTVDADSAATVNIKSRNGAFALQVGVSSGTTTLRLNTYKAGETGNYSLGEMVWAADGSVTNRTLVSDPIDAPLDPAQYDLNVTVGGVEQDLAALWIRERATNGVTAGIAPRSANVSEWSSGADVQSGTLPPWNDSLARDDWLLLHVNATGVEGALGVRGAPNKSLLGEGGDVAVEFDQTNPPINGPDNEFDGDAVERLFLDPNTEGFYLAVDTAEHGIEPGDRYRVSFVVPEDGQLADSTQNVSTEFRVVERRVELNGGSPDDAIVVDGETTISGTTTLTPGTTINLTARGPDITPPVFEHRELTVRDDRTFGTTFDFSDLEPGREFEFRLRDQSKIVPAVVAGATTTVPPTTATPDPTTTQPATTTVPQTTATPDLTTTQPATTTAPATTTTAAGLTQVPVDANDRVLTQRPVQDGGGSGVVPVPGFGPATSALGLVAALVLAARRL